MAESKGDRANKQSECLEQQHTTTKKQRWDRPASRPMTHAEKKGPQKAGLRTAAKPSALESQINKADQNAAKEPPEPKLRPDAADEPDPMSELDQMIDMIGASSQQPEWEGSTNIIGQGVDFIVEED